MPEPMEIDDTIGQSINLDEWHPRLLFPPRDTTIDPDGNLVVAIYSRERLRDCFQRQVEELEQRIHQNNVEPAFDGGLSDYVDELEELRNHVIRQNALLEAGNDTFVDDEDYFYDVLDNRNMIARYRHRQGDTPSTTLVVGQRIMTWLEFRALTTRHGGSSQTTFAEFRDHLLRFGIVEEVDETFDWSAPEQQEDTLEEINAMYAT